MSNISKMLDYTQFEALGAIVFLNFKNFEIARLTFDPRSFDMSSRDADHYTTGEMLEVGETWVRIV
jgi:hypothetical protein